MNIKEAKEILKDIMVNTYAEGKAEAINTVLNELENKDKTINNMLDYISKPYRITILGGKNREKLRKYFTRKK